MLPDSKRTFSELAEWYLDLDKIKELDYFKAARRHFGIFNTEYGGFRVGELRLEHGQAFQVKTVGDYPASYTETGEMNR